MNASPKAEAPLPPGWAWTTLGETTHIVQGQSPPSSTYNDDGEGLPFYQGKLEFGPVYPTPRKWCSAPKKVAEKGDVLISVRAPVGPTNICPAKSCIGRGLAAVRPLCDVPTPFLLYLLRTNEARLAGKGTGSTFSAISGDDLRALDVTLPPLPEQRRIVARIEELFSKLDAGVAELVKAKAQLKRYRQAVLKAAFSGELTAEWRRQRANSHEPIETAAKLLERIRKARANSQVGKGQLKHKEPPPLDTSDLPELPEGWVWARVLELGCVGEQAVLTGPFGTSLGRRDFVATGVPVLTIGCLTFGRLDMGKVLHVAAEKALALGKYSLQAGDLLFSRMATVGRAGIVTGVEAGALFNYHIMRLRLEPSLMLPSCFVAYVRGSSVVRDYVREVNHGATRDGINTNQLLMMPVPVPPLAEQVALELKLGEQMSVLHHSEGALAVELRRSGGLRQSILKRAFEGKLVPQDPDDEPAEKLLERIRAEKAKREAAPKSRRRTTGKRRK